MQKFKKKISKHLHVVKNSGFSTVKSFVVSCWDLASITSQKFIECPEHTCLHPFQLDVVNALYYPLFWDPFMLSTHLLQPWRKRRAESSCRSSFWKSAQEYVCVCVYLLINRSIDTYTYTYIFDYLKLLYSILILFQNTNTLFLLVSINIRKDKWHMCGV